MARQMTAYEILGVNEDATDSKIKKEYRRLAKKFHPDHNPGNEKAAAVMKAVNEAWGILRDNRAAYDRLLANARRPAPVMQGFTISFYRSSGGVTSTTTNYTTGGW